MAKTKKKTTSWIVTALKHNLAITPEVSTIEVVDKANAAKVAELMNLLGAAAHYYPKGYYPDFDTDGNLS